MMSRGTWRTIGELVISLAAVLLLLSCGVGDAKPGDDQGPYIAELMPAAASPGAIVDLLGLRFCGDDPEAAAQDGTCATPPAGTVAFGANAQVLRATVAGWKDERITVAVPSEAAAGATLVVVTVNGVASNPVDFEVQ